MKNQQIHIPVLLGEVLQYLEPKAEERYLDLTAGYGGHAQEILGRTLNPNGATLVDRDHIAIGHLRGQREFDGSEIIQQDFLSASIDLLARGSRYDIILADLGVSSPHLDNASRGFSIVNDGPLDMRMDSSQELTAKTIVNSYEEAGLVKLLRDYGEEPRARAIAHTIVEHRPVTSTHELADIIARAAGKRPARPAKRIHPATRSFQALRIAVNDELGLLTTAMPKWLELLAPGGRIAIISFHSLEDRQVKQFFAENTGDRYDARLRLLTKKQVSAGAQELASNPRARSAKLRAAVKINIKGRGS
ncbi:MAG TPA: 16S rRNA (cytosine(1402)-N(4))-methyltransferase RsmH [Candidatus Saccharimonadales bacterium]|nr:16S rRNA (cytosine(1402)-N(4))-methyltransferase RsmH [Candidatus Saccharimonadales bacterium]